MIRKVCLDYCARKSSLGRVLLVTGVLAACGTGAIYGSLSDRAGQWEQVAMKAAQQGAASVANRGNAEDRDRLLLQVEAANEIIGRLSLPWNELFKGIENSAIDGVALLGVQPQPQQRLITLNGEARSYADVLEYMARLDSSAAFTHARLLSHKVKGEDPHHPVAFAIAASWRIAP